MFNYIRVQHNANTMQWMFPIMWVGLVDGGEGLTGLLWVITPIEPPSWVKMALGQWTPYPWETLSLPLT